jgi:iron(II)-dependent oxidoreductase
MNIRRAVARDQITRELAEARQRTDFAPYPDFESFPYREYSEIFFGPDYKVLCGGSWATRPHAIRNTFRNWDYPIRRRLFCGFQCAK